MVSIFSRREQVARSLQSPGYRAAVDKISALRIRAERATKRSQLQDIWKEASEYMKELKNGQADDYRGVHSQFDSLFDLIADRERTRGAGKKNLRLPPPEGPSLK